MSQPGSWATSSWQSATAWRRCSRPTSAGRRALPRRALGDLLGRGPGHPRRLRRARHRRRAGVSRRLSPARAARAQLRRLRARAATARHVDLARAFPHTSIVLEHVGTPVGVGAYAGRREERFPLWRENMRLLARCENVTVKLGGLASPVSGLSYLAPQEPGSERLAAEWKPYVETAIELFGAARCMFESDFPSVWAPVPTPSSGTPSSASRATPHRLSAKRSSRGRRHACTASTSLPRPGGLLPRSARPGRPRSRRARTPPRALAPPPRARRPSPTPRRPSPSSA
jgi:hypothetical protein